jgi:hypothetical protein
MGLLLGMPNVGLPDSELSHRVLILTIWCAEIAGVASILIDLILSVANHH